MISNVLVSEQMFVIFKVLIFLNAVFIFFPLIINILILKNEKYELI